MGYGARGWGLGIGGWGLEAGGGNREREVCIVEVRSYRDLKVWQLGIEVAKEVYVLTGGFPKHEAYGLSSQL